MARIWKNINYRDTGGRRDSERIAEKVLLTRVQGARKPVGLLIRRRAQLRGRREISFSPSWTDRPTNHSPFPALTYYPSTFCRTISFLFPGSQCRNTATDIRSFYPRPIYYTWDSLIKLAIHGSYCQILTAK